MLLPAYEQEAAAAVYTGSPRFAPAAEMKEFLLFGHTIESSQHCRETSSNFQMIRTYDQSCHMEIAHLQRPSGQPNHLLSRTLDNLNGPAEFAIFHRHICPHSLISNKSSRTRRLETFMVLNRKNMELYHY